MKKTLMICIALFCATLVATPSNAGFTAPINPGPETPLSTILNNIYGAGNLTRIDDFGAGITDQIWFNPNGSAEAEAKFAGFSQSFGIYYDSNDNGALDTYLKLFDVTSNGYLSGTPSASIPHFNNLPNGYLFSFYNDPSGADRWNSIPNLNSDKYDHMVTYWISGNTGKPNNILGNYVIAWEDLPKKIGSSIDYDYNDLVVEVHNVRPVPEPATMLISALTLAGAGGFVRRKFFKKS